jgi:hypothetical protein
VCGFVTRCGCLWRRPARLWPVVWSLLAANCGGEAFRESPLIIGVARIPARLSPYTLRSPEERLLAGYLHDGLYRAAAGTTGAPATPVMANGLPSPTSIDLREFDVSLPRAPQGGPRAGVSAADVLRSWDLLQAPANENLDRVLLSTLIRRIRALGASGLRVTISRPAVPEDVASLLTFPVLPGIARRSGVPLALHPDSATPGSVGEDLLTAAEGGGRYRLIGRLGPGLPAAVLWERGLRAVVLRRLESAAAQRTALANDEIDVLVDPDPALVQRPPKGYHVENSADSLQFALLWLRPDAAGQSARSAVARGRSAARTPAAADTVCQDWMRPRGTLVVLATHPGALLESVAGELRARLRCQGIRLRLLQRSSTTPGPPGFPADAALLRLEDGGGDVPVLEAWLRRFAPEALRPVAAIADEWRHTASPRSRRRLRDAMIDSLRMRESLVVLGRWREARLVRDGVLPGAW